MKPEKEELQELVKACAGGDPESLKRFFECFSEDIYSFPMKVFHLSEDDAGEFFIYAFERLKSGKRFQTYIGKSAFKTWFYSVLRNMLIDWKRTKKEIKTNPNYKVNSDGVEYSTIENEPDKMAGMKEEAGYYSEKFREALSEIKLENRVIFKLSFIYYLNLEKDEIEYILEKTGLNSGELTKEILRMRELLSDREQENMEMEDKITSIYNNILELKEAKIKEKTEGFQENSPLQNRTDQLIAKKYEQIRKLVVKKNKGHFLARTPYKLISGLLGISEGGISVTLIRVTEKIQKKIQSII
ncbi:MAG: sigma-70 family RNA polymerase sigma factor [Leptospira sp.]|nr:sigma-70 family RNA polymerase sigma factor [Leptospira sp.]